MRIKASLLVGLLTVVGMVEAQTLPTTPVYSFSAVGGFAPNGNLMSYSDTVMGSWNFSYDGLNRVTGAALAPPPGGPAAVNGNLGYCWSYDNFGNRTNEYGSNQPFATTQPCQAASGASLTNTWAHYTVDGTLSTGDNGMNRLTQTNARGVTANVTYDASGDVSYDGANSYLYDAEGRVCAEGNGSGYVGYLSDAEGRRVAKGIITSLSCNLATNNFTPTNEYALGQGGEQVSEVVPDPSGTMVWQHSNVYANSALLASYDSSGLHFMIDDWLGTRRIQTDAAGTVEQYCQGLPFGNGLYCSASLTAPTEHHFTGKERDSESGLDYFGARYYGSNMGRFMSPDYSDAPVAVPFATLSNPQTLNLYSYVGNNPLSVTDPFGHNWFTDFLNGVANATYRPLATAVQHPIITGRAVGNAVTHPVATYHALKSGVVTTSQQVMTGNGTAIGTAVGTVGMAVIPGVGEAGEAAEGAADLAKVGEVADAAEATEAAAAGASAPVDTSGYGNIGGGSTTAENALTQANNYLGPGAKEIAPGVFRSADGTRQFRMTTGDITGAHGNIGPHVHFESIGSDGRTITENSHVGITNP